MFLWMTLALTTLLTLAHTQANQFTNPPPFDSTSPPLTFIVGQSYDLTWTTSWTSLTLYLQSNGSGSDGNPLQSLTFEGAPTSPFPFFVGTNIDLSLNPFHFEIYSTDESNGFVCQNFYVVAGSGSSVTTTPPVPPASSPTTTLAAVVPTTVSKFVTVTQTQVVQTPTLTQAVVPLSTVTRTTLVSPSNSETSTTASTTSTTTAKPTVTTMASGAAGAPVSRCGIAGIIVGLGGFLRALGAF